jgi:release factor glutamine methyltransferase
MQAPGMRLVHIPGVHRPRSDTWLLAEVLAREGLRGAEVADVCTGSGALAIAAARHGASVLAADVSRRALLAARLNARLNGCTIRLCRSDLLDGLGGMRFDVVVCNPPYVPAATDELPRHRARTALDAGRDGRALLDRVCRDAPAHLRAGGSLLVVHSSVCGVARTLELLRAGGLAADVALRERGPLGPVLAARAQLLRSRGLLGAADEEELVVIRARAAPVAHAAAPVGEHARAGR